MNFKERLINIIKEKKTCLCLSLDISYFKPNSKCDDNIYGFNIIELCASYICMLKIHCDLVRDFDDNVINKLIEYSKNYNFLIMEDAKLSDVGSINYDKILANNYKMYKWADCITCCWYNYCDTKIELEKHNINNIELICLCDMNLIEINKYIDFNYYDIINNFIDKIDSNEKLKINAIITQNRLTDKNVLRLTPGVIENTNDINLDNMKYRKYRSIQEAICNEKNHIVIIGSDIIKHKTIKEITDKCKSCSEESWKYFSLIHNK